MVTRSTEAGSWVYLAERVHLKQLLNCVVEKMVWLKYIFTLEKGTMLYSHLLEDLLQMQASLIRYTRQSAETFRSE